MGNIPSKVSSRLADGIKRFKPIVLKAKDKDVNESDTVTIIVDILSEVFGYNKYTDITSEFAIKKTFCDLAIKLDGNVKLLIEAKAAGLNLKDQHIKQAVDYGANSGVEWVILTNSVQWKIYKIIFAKPVATELVYEFDFTELNTKKDSDLELVYYLTKEAMSKSGKTTLDDYRNHKQILNKYVISQLLLSEPVIDSIRKTLKKVSSDTKASNEEISRIINDEIIKRDVLDDDKMVSTKKLVSKALAEANKAKEKDTSKTE